MKVILNTDSNIQGDEALAGHVDGVVENVLGRFAPHLTRVEVHLSDLNAGKTGDQDKRCVMEARLEGRQPMMVDNDADTVSAAISGAAQKLKRAIDSSLGRLAG